MAAPQQVAGYPNLYWVGSAQQTFQHAVQPTLLQRLQNLAKASGQKLYILSGYRPPAYSARVGGFSDDPHTKHIAADVTTAAGKPIGEYYGAKTLQSYGLRSGNVPNFYHGQPDPEHVDLVGQEQAAQNSNKTNPGWQVGLLTAIGAPITNGNIKLLNLWHDYEGGSAKFNPLNTTQPAPNATDYNSAHVKNYNSAAQGISATAQTLTNGKYPTILAALRSGTPAEYFGKGNNFLQSELEANTWGTGPHLIRDFVAGKGASSSIFGSPVIDAVTGGASAVAGAAQAVASPFEAIGNFFGWITDAKNIKRIGMVILGALMMLIGLFLLAKETGATEQGASIATMVATRGAVK